MEPHQVRARYPFLPAATEWVRDHGPSLDELLGDMAYASARSMGKRRVIATLDKENPWRSHHESEPESINELLSYVIARILVSINGDKYLVRRFALAEAERVNHALQGEPLDFVAKGCKALGIQLSDLGEGEGGGNGRAIRIHFIHFLQYTSQMRSQEWKLVNMDLKDGHVLLDQRRVCRIVQEVLRRKSETDLPLAVPKAVMEALEAEVIEIKEVLEERKKEFEPYEMGVIRAECFPPCIKHYLAAAQRGENLPHNARFALATFLHTVGMGNEEILGIFANSPDFREDLARYQIDHVTGEISGTEYTPPECTTMVTFGICVDKDSLCEQEWMTHPLKYYRVKCRPYRRKKGAGGGGRRQSEKADEEE